MTVKEYMDALKHINVKPTHPGMPSFAEAALDTTDIWSNDACKGYAIRACKSLGYSREQTKTLLQAMGWAFDDISVDEAVLEYVDF